MHPTGKNCRWIKAILYIPVAFYVAFMEGWNDFRRDRIGEGGDWDEIK